VECDFIDESSKRLNLLNAPECSQSTQIIEICLIPLAGLNIYLNFMTLNKIIILDDKAPSEGFSSSQLLSNLTVGERLLVDYYESTETLWLESNKR
jgi:hypothetical protein